MEANNRFFAIVSVLRWYFCLTKVAENYKFRGEAVPMIFLFGLPHICPKRVGCDQFVIFKRFLYLLVFLSICRSEMVFLPDLSDGETSDGGAGRENFDGPGRTSSGILNFDDELMTSAPNINNNNRHAGAGMYFSMLKKKLYFMFSYIFT